MTKLKQTEPAITGPRSLRDPRSREYAIQTMRSLKRFLESKLLDVKGVSDELRLIEQYKHWEACGFETLNDYLRAEIGITYKELKRRLAQDLAADPDVTPLATAEEAKSLRAEGGKKGGRGKKNLDANGMEVSRRIGSNNATYLVRRLKRDTPEIAEALARGEYPSARAAGIAAGFIKVPTPFDKILKLLPKLTAADLDDLRATLLAEMQRRAA